MLSLPRKSTRRKTLGPFDPRSLLRDSKLLPCIVVTFPAVVPKATWGFVNAANKIKRLMRENTMKKWDA